MGLRDNDFMEFMSNNSKGKDKITDYDIDRTASKPKIKDIKGKINQKNQSISPEEDEEKGSQT